MSLRNASKSEMISGGGYEAGGRMAAMGKLLMSGSSLEPTTAEEMARERVTMLAVQKEMSEADEANLLEEEDMHVFDQEPLSDHFSLVSCNTCKKPIKISQYAAHAERCRSLMSDDSCLEDGLRKPSRKLRNGLLAEPEVSDEAADSGISIAETQLATGRTGKRTMNGGEVGTAPKVGRPRKLSVHSQRDLTDGGVEDFMVAGPSSTGQLEGLSSCGKRRKQFLPFTPQDLDVMCGVPSPRSGAPCRQPLTCKSHSLSSKRAVAGRRRPFDALLQELKENVSRKTQAEIPRPLATKVYCSSHQQRMRGVIGSMYQESLSEGGRAQGGDQQQLQLDSTQLQQQQMMLMGGLSKGL